MDNQAPTCAEVEACIKDNNSDEDAGSFGSVGRVGSKGIDSNATNCTKVLVPIL